LRNQNQAVNLSGEFGRGAGVAIDADFVYNKE
jgi:hypothetical protein